MKGVIKTNIIAISGKAQHGKDTTAAILKELLEADGYRVLTVHYADLLKQICRSFFGWDGQKNAEGRHILQYVGTDIIREKHPDYWVDFVIGILNMFPDEWDYVLIPDCRFPNEIDRLREAGFDTIHIRVVRLGFTSPLTAQQQAHPSETALDRTIPDYTVHNAGTLGDLTMALSDWVTAQNHTHQLSFSEVMAADGNETAQPRCSH